MTYLNINGVQFNIDCPNDEKLNDILEECITICNEPIFKTINISVVNDKKLLKDEIAHFAYKQAIVHESFINQRHYQVFNKYIVDSKEYMIIKNSNNEYTMIGDGSNKIYKWIMRVIRELLIRLLEDQGYYYMHSTGLKINDKEMLLLGNSGSGKTTFMMKLLNGDNVSLLSNDRVFLNSFHALYYPLALRLAMGTVKNIKELDDYFRCNHILESRKHKDYETSSNTDKCDLPNQNLLKIYPKLKLVSELQNRIFIFTRLGNSLSINKMNYDDIINNLDNCNFTPNDKENNRKEWLYYRTTSQYKIEKGKKELYDYLANHYDFYQIDYPYDMDSFELKKELVMKHVI